MDDFVELPARGPLTVHPLFKLSNQAHWSHSQSHTNNEFFKLVQALLQIHSFFFSQSADDAL